MDASARRHLAFEQDRSPDHGRTAETTPRETPGPDLSSDAATDGAASAGPALADGVETLELLEERLTVSKRRGPSGIVRVGTRTEAVEVTAAAELERYEVEVTRVPVGHAVAEAPPARAEGDTTVNPVVEERLLVVKQLFLVEDLQVRHVLRRETATEAVTLRRRRAVVERRNLRHGSAVDGEPGPG